MISNSSLYNCENLDPLVILNELLLQRSHLKAASLNHVTRTPHVPIDEDW